MKPIPSRLLAFVKPHVWVLLVSLCLVAIVGLLEAVTPFLIGLIFDTVLRASATPTIAIPFVNFQLNLSATDGTIFLVLLIAATTLKAIAEYGSVNATAYLGQAVVRDLRNDLFERILLQPLRFFHFNPTGELISRVSADVERIQTAASETLAEFLKQAAILVFLMITIFVIDWKLAAASLALAPLVFYPTVWFGKRLRLLSRSNQQEMAEMANILYETVAGNRIVKAFSMENAEAGRFRRVTERIFKLNLRQRMTHSLASPLMEVLGVLVVAAFLLYARSQIINQRMTVGLFVAFIIALIKLYDPVRRMSGINNSFQQAFGASGRIFEILALDTEKDSGQITLSRFSDRIDFDDVHFAYEPGVPVLEGISFSVGRGEVLAVVGSSGAGKTTLVNLLPRFYDVTQGGILIDGTNVRDFQLQSLRKQIAIVTQDVILFNDTIRANIAYGEPAAGEDAILRAAKAALVDEFVTSFDRRVGERGLRLSGGERQRLSIARALLKDAPILILDEATSSLDTESEALVQQALQNLMAGRTTIVIAHRLSTVRRADRIIVLADGRIKESGTHEELVVRRGLYWKLYNLQFQTWGDRPMPIHEAAEGGVPTGLAGGPDV
jgi:subfamily B ATP-binding cassette protein MsbA